MLSSQSLHKTRACVLRIAWSFIGTGYGARTRVTALKGLRPVQLDESGIVRFSIALAEESDAGNGTADVSS